MYGIFLNATNIYRKYAKELGITAPKELKFWACTTMNGGITLMRDVIVADSASVGAAIGTGVCPGAGTIIGTVVGAGIGIYLPDIMISLNSSYPTKSESITECVFHEMAHASHFTGLGVGSVTYWNEEYIKMLGGWASVLCNGSSPSKNCYNDGKSKQVCYIESWGYFIGYYFTDKYYSSYTTAIDYKIYLRGNYKDYSYFYYDSYYKLLDYLTVSQIFNPYKYFAVQSINSWFNKLKSLYGATIDIDEINNVFKERGISL